MGRRSTAQKGLALVLGAAVLAAVPARTILDAAAPDRRAHVESSHDPGRCGYLHDHAACQQLFASAASVAPDPATDRTLPLVADAPAPRSHVRADAPAGSATLPRAPPRPA